MAIKDNCVIDGCAEQGKTVNLGQISGAPSLTLCSQHSWDFFWDRREKSRNLAAAIHEANPEMNHTPGWTYAIRLANGNVKLGYTADPSMRRLKTLSGKSNQGIPVQVLALMKGGESLEAAIHEQWKSFRVTGQMEEFYADPLLLEWASDQGIDPAISNFEDYLIDKHGRGKKGEYAQDMFEGASEKALEIHWTES